MSDPLAAMLDAARAGDRARLARLVATRDARLDGDVHDPASRVELQVHLRAPTTAADLPDALWARWGGRAGTRGVDLMNVWLPLDAIEPLLAARPEVAFIRLPERGFLLTGPTESLGAERFRSHPDLQCTGASGEGVVVAVVDGGFEKLDASIESGETPHVIDPPAFTGGTHGTMCAEVVADVAPAATIYPYSSPTVADMQAFRAEIEGGNPRGIDVVTHSVIWFGQSFGRHDGFACDLVDRARAQGVAWVNASGNSGNGDFYAGAFTDTDKDGNHDVLPGDPKLVFNQHHTGQIRVVLDWDDYGEPTTNLDLYLFRYEDGTWKEVEASTNIHGGFIPPIESFKLDGAPTGVYAFVIRGEAVTPGLRFRLVNLGHGNGPLSVWHKSGNVYDPGNCKGVLTVGALRAERYDEGPLEAYSSHGPLIDGRMKPELVAPTTVKTSVGWFGGTSCACPHAAGLVALYAQMHPDAGPETWIDMAIGTTEPMGTGLPNDPYGWGRIEVSSDGVGWQCDGSDTAAYACSTPCETTGTTSCSPTCGLGTCVPPLEVCNGADDDCDGETDETQDCVPGQMSACTTFCGSEGSRVCTDGCDWQPCQPPAEVCNGLDDDCDGSVDEDVPGCATEPDAGGADGLSDDVEADVAEVAPKKGGKGGGCSAGGPPSAGGAASGRAAGWPLLLVGALLAVLGVRRRVGAQRTST
jgi:hypothetical protein